MVPQATVSWVGKCLGIVAVLLGATVLFRWATGPLEPLPDPTQAVRDSAQRVYAADSVRWAVTVQNLTRVYTTLQRERDSLRAHRPAPRVVYVRDSRMANDTTVPTPGANVPETGTPNNPSSGAGLSDSTPYVPLAAYTALERELSIADTVIETQAAIIRADSAAYARLASLRAFEDSTHKSAFTKLAADLSRARRGCRVLGLLPCPTITVGYGAALAPGLVTGPAVVVGFPIKL